MCSSVPGQPRSVAEIRGVRFISALPPARDDLVGRLQVLQGFASQGLKFLRDVGAVKMIYVPGDQRAPCEVVSEWATSRLLFAREQISPRSDGSQPRLERITDTVRQLPPGGERARVIEGVTRLENRSRRRKRFRPVVVTVMGG